jgi:ribosomal protein S18 acetylase RimI-like enzyme
VSSPTAAPISITPVLVRVAHPEEYEAIGNLVADVYRDEEFVHGAYLDVLRDAAGRAAAAELLVAIAPDGQLAGTITYAAGGTPFADVAGPDEAEFRMLAVAPAARGHGVGERLVQACITRAHGQGRERLVISTQAEMQRAHRLYERLGFVRAPERDWSPEPSVQLRVYRLDLDDA